MARVLSSRKAVDGLFLLALGAALLSLLLYPAQAVEAARSGWELCCGVIIPSLFPFFVLSSLCVELGLVRYLSLAMQRVMQPLFGVSGACAPAFALGIIGGYPVGARTAISLYEKRYITRYEAEHLLAFCNNCGPAFILGVAGASVFHSSGAGLLLYGAHIAASVLVGMVMKPRGTGGREAVPAAVPASVPPAGFATAFTGCVKDSFFSTLGICAFVIFFTVVVRMLFLTGAMTAAAAALGWVLGRFGLTADLAERLLIGIIELSSGVWSLADAAGTLPGRLSMAAFILGWAGLSVHCQVLSFLGTTGLRVRTYLFGKLLHGLFSAALVWGLARLLPLREPVAVYLAREVSGLASMNFSAALTASTVAAGCVWLVVMVICLGMMAKEAFHRRRNVV